MTAGELIAEFRAAAFDEVEPYLWSDAELLLYIDDAQTRFVRAIGGVRDTTSRFNLFQLAVGATGVRRNPLVLRVARAFLLAHNTELSVEAGAIGRGFNLQSGMPAAIYPDVDDGWLLFDKLLDKPDTLQLHVFRLPINRVDDKDSELEVRIEFKEVVMQWVRHRAYRKMDAEAFNKGESDAALGSYMRLVEEAKRDNNRRQEPVRVVRYGGL